MALHPRSLFFLFGIAIIFGALSYGSIDPFMCYGLLCIVYFLCLWRWRYLTPVIILIFFGFFTSHSLTESAYEGRMGELRATENLILRSSGKALDVEGILGKELFRKDRSRVFLMTIDTFASFDTFATGSTYAFPEYKEEKLPSPSIFVEVPSNLTIFPGERIRFHAKISTNLHFPLSGYEKFSFFHRGYGMAFVTNFSRIEKVGPSLREKIQKNATTTIDQGFPRVIAGTLLGMTIGVIDLLSENVKKDFIGSGLAHILVVSGSNIAFLIIFLSIFFRYIPLPRRVLESIIIISILLYGSLVSWDTSVLRATMMGILSYLVASQERKISSKASLLGAFLVLFFLEPLAPLYDAGFGLSFGATLGIILFDREIKKYTKKYHIPEVFAAIFSVSLGAMLGSLPVLVYHFGTISIFSLIANILIAPILGWILFSTVIFFFVASISHFLSYLWGFLVYFPTLYVLKVSEFFSNWGVFVVPEELRTLICVLFLGIYLMYFIGDLPRVQKDPQPSNSNG